MFASRQVRHLRLKAPTGDLARRASILLEDAFHTATLPTDDARLWLVRKLSLGTIDPRSVGQTAALNLEQCFARLSLEGIHAEDPDAATAVAVFFRDPLEPYRCLANRLLRGKPAHEWFWPLVVPGWTGESPVPSSWRRLIFHLVLQPAGPLALAEILDEAGQHQVVEMLLAAFRPDDGPALLHACNWSPPGGTEFDEQPVECEAVAPHWRKVLSKFSSSWGKEDARTLWIAAIALIAARPVLLADSRLIPRALSLVSAFSPEAPKNRPQAPLINFPGFVDSANLEGSPDVPSNIANASRKFLQRPKLVDHASVPDSTEEDRIPFDPLTAETDCAGLLFLVPVLQRLGIEDFLEHHPELFEVNFPARILLQVAERFRAASSDTIYNALRPKEGVDAWPRRFIAPSSWQKDLARWRNLQIRPLSFLPGGCVLTDSSGTLILGAWTGKAPVEISRMIVASSRRRRAALQMSAAAELFLNAWVTAAYRWTRRFAGIGLGALVRRPGRCAATRTHLDLFFDGREADLRIRRAGLDLDPGWVPWLGKVIHFHYD
jgi:hypothetical protein